MALTPDEWTFITSLDGYSQLGLRAGHFYTGDANGPRRLVDPANPIGLLPLLERTWSVAMVQLAEKNVELGLAPGTLEALVPWRRLPLVASEFPGDYWALLAVEWLAAMPVADRDMTALQRFSTSRSVTQRTRHRARRILQSS